MKSLIVGGLYAFTEDETKPFRIIHLDDYFTYTIDVNTSGNEVPKQRSTLLLKDQLKQELIKTVADPNQKIIEENSLSKKQINKRDQRYEVISALWNNEREKKRFYEKPLRRGLYKQVADELGISDRAARTLISNYLKGGMTRNSLIPEYRSRGGTGTERKRFRLSDNGLENWSAGEEEREQFKKAYEKIVLKEGRNYKEAYNYLIEQYYTRQIPDSQGRTKTVYIKETPTEDQFRYWIKKHRVREDEIIAVKGEREYDNNYRADRGSFRESLTGPGNLAEIDAMNCNVSIVSEVDRNLIIGRPLLYNAIDVFTGAILGFYLGIENESWRTTAFTLMNIIEDKVDFCARYNIKIEEEDWPCHYLPILLKGDKGALNNPKAKTISDTYKMDFTYAPAYHPRLKPNIEHMHKYYQDYFEKHLAKFGADQWNSGERGVQDARELACLTLEELTKIVIKLTLKYNATINKNYPLTPSMIAQGVTASPLKLWEWGVKEGMATIIKVSDPDKFRLFLFKRCTRTIREEGIHLHTHLYVAAATDTARLINNKMGETVVVSYNEDDITEAYIFKDEQYYPLKMKDFCEDYRGMSVKEERKLRRLSAYRNQKKYQHEYLDQIDVDHYIEEITHGKEAIIPKTKTQRQKRVKNIKKNQKEYIQDQKIKENLERKAGEEPLDRTINSQNENEMSGFDKRRRLFIEKALKEMEKENQDEN